MAEGQLTEIPVVFYRTGTEAEPVRDWLESLSAEDRRIIGTDLARTGRMADWHAVVPLAWRRAMGGPQQPVEQQDCAVGVLCRERSDRGGARFHQEDAEDPTGRYCPGAKADEGDDEMSKSKKNPRWGSTLDEFLDEEGIREAAKAEAVTRVVAWQLSEEMKRQGISKARLAELMNTSRAQVDRVLKAKGNVTIETLQRAAALVGRQVRLELV